MLAFSRASITRPHFYNIRRKTLLSNLCILLGARRCDHPYHSINSPSLEKNPIPRNDYTVDGNVARSNWLITKLSREGRIGEARRVFDEMPDRDVVTWTTVISGYIKCGMMEEARKMFDRVDAEKNVVTWTAMVSGYIRLNKITEAEKLFNEMPHKNVVSWNTMIDGYAKNGRVDSALHLFEQMGERNVVSWNTVITALAHCGRIEEAMGLFDSMPKRDVISWTAMVAGLSKNGRIDEARLLFDRMQERNVVTWNAMVTGYAQNLRLNEACDLFERMPERDLPSWNAMITGFVQNGDLRRARELFNEMPRKNVISWTTMVSGYVQDGKNEEALQIFSRMLAADWVKPNEGTFVSVLGACSNLAGLSEGQQVHQRIIKTVYQNRAFVISSLINMYSKCGEIGIARKIFDDGLTFQRDLISWSGMIAAYAHHGCGREAISLFEKMRALGFKPDEVTYVGLLSACSHAGLVEEGLKYFDELMADRSIEVREDHYACLVDLCGRAGRLEEALGFIERLGQKPSASIWGALLAGCNVYSNTNIGKMAGCSWIEVGNRVHVFVVGEKSHSQFELIYALLNDLHLHMKKAH